MQGEGKVVINNEVSFMIDKSLTKEIGRTLGEIQ